MRWSGERRDPGRRGAGGGSRGFRGPWGTAYPVNLRLRLASMSEDDWVTMAKTKQSRPPMPWFDLHEMSEADLRAVHRFVVSLGTAGEPAAAYVPPDAEPTSPYFDFTPVVPEGGGAAR